MPIAIETCNVKTACAVLEAHKHSYLIAEVNLLFKVNSKKPGPTHGTRNSAVPSATTEHRKHVLKEKKITKQVLSLGSLFNYIKIYILSTNLNR